MKKTKRLQSIFVLLLCFVLITAVALFSAGCKTSDTLGENNSSSPITSSNTSSEENAPKVLGEGNTSFSFSVTYKDGKTDYFTINTDKTTVGAALLELNLIAGEDSQYGLYVKTVNGETLDYDTDKMYWAFYENDAYAQSGVDTTEIKADTSYAFKASK